MINIALAHARRHTHARTHAHTLSATAKTECKREILSHWNRCSRVQGMCSQQLPGPAASKTDETQLTISEWCSGPAATWIHPIHCSPSANTHAHTHTHFVRETRTVTAVWTTGVSKVHNSTHNTHT